MRGWYGVMVLVDARVGSRELLQGLRGLGIDAELGGNLSADFQFSGCGPAPASTVLIGIERKTIQDLLNSIRTRRFEGQQLSPMLDCYDCCYLVVEGAWRRGKGTGLIEIPRGRGEWGAPRGSFHYAEVSHFLIRLEEFAGVRVRRTYDEDETCAAIADLYTEWAAPYEERLRKLQRIYAPPPDFPIRKDGKRVRAFAVQQAPSLAAKWIAQLPGVDSRAVELAERFRSARDVANADVEDWLSIKGLRVGRKSAEKIVEAVNGS
mgnify:CR=1 FL=1